MNIGQAAKASGVAAKNIRYYEGVGLIAPAGRSSGNYRVYSERDVHTLRFIRYARELGFSIDEVTTLLELWNNRERTSAEVKALAKQHLERLERKLLELNALRTALLELAAKCSGDSRPDCPILAELATGGKSNGGARSFDARARPRGEAKSVRHFRK